MADAGGVLLAHFDGYLNPRCSSSSNRSDTDHVIPGGLGPIVGSVLGAIVLTILPEALRGFAEYRMVIYSLLLIILMITRPQGLLGKAGGFKGRSGRRRARTAAALKSADPRSGTSLDESPMPPVNEPEADTARGKEEVQ
jgi:hypothetical protein